MWWSPVYKTCRKEKKLLRVLAITWLFDVLAKYDDRDYSAISFMTGDNAYVNHSRLCNGCIWFPRADGTGSSGITKRSGKWSRSSVEQLIVSTTTSPASLCPPAASSIFWWVVSAAAVVVVSHHSSSQSWVAPASQRGSAPSSFLAIQSGPKVGGGAGGSNKVTVARCALKPASHHPRLSGPPHGRPQLMLLYGYTTARDLNGN